MTYIIFRIQWPKQGAPQGCKGQGEGGQESQEREEEKGHQRGGSLLSGESCQVQEGAWGEAEKRRACPGDISW